MPALTRPVLKIMPNREFKRERISPVAGTILVAVTVSVGTLVFYIMQQHAENLLRRSLESSLQNRVERVQSEVQGGFVATSTLLRWNHPPVEPGGTRTIHPGRRGLGADRAGGRIDKLKIDQSFVRDVAAGADNEAMASEIIVMADRLKIRVVAEGVETEAQLAFLGAASAGDRDKGV